MIQGLLGRDALRRIVYKDLPEQVPEVLQEIRAGRDHRLSFQSAYARSSTQGGSAYLKALHSPNKSFRATGGVDVGVIELEALEVSAFCQLSCPTKSLREGNKLGRRVRAAVPAGHFVDILDEIGIYPFADNRLHHGQMLKVIVCLEQSISRKEFDEDATYTPDVTGE